MLISILLNLLFLVIGMFFLIKGADFFVDGASRVAKALKIPSLIIGLTLVSIGTSLPELSVSVTAAVGGSADISYGNVIGSNIFNVFVVIGASAILTPMIIDKSMKKYDVPILLGIYGLFTIFSFVITPNVLDRVESIIFCLLFIGYLVFLVLRTKKENAGKEEEEVVEEEKPRKMWVNIVFIILGLVAIVAGGEFVVTTAKTLAIMAGMDELLVGLTIVAVGTSLPELVTSMVAAKKGENDIAVGNAVGSSIFNILLILGLASTIVPIGFETSTIIDVVAMIISAGMIMLFAYKGAKVNRWQGIIMIITYAIYLTFIILRNYGMF